MNFEKVPEPADLPAPPARRRGSWWFALTVLVAVAALVWWLAGSGTPEPAPAARSKTGTRIAFLEGRLEVIAKKLAQPNPAAPPGADRRFVEEAVERQNELMRLRPVPRPDDAFRLAEWQVRLGTFIARDWTAQSRELETAAAGLFRQGRTAEGVERLKEALRLQREVNLGPAGPESKDLAREAQLEQEAERREAEPQQAEAAQVLAQARDAVQAGRWSEALQLYGRARDLQLRLNRDYAHSRFNDWLVVDRIAAEMAALGANEAHEQLEGLVQQAAVAAEAQSDLEAGRLLAAAAGRQRFINEQFPRSRFVSMERLEQIETELQTIRMRAPLAEVRALDGAAAGHLRRREIFQAQQQIGPAAEKLAAAVRALPQARGVDELLRRRLGYLSLRQADLAAIQDLTYDRLLPLPGNEKVALLRTEVPQELYARVMNTNPSRDPEHARPVDSVTYDEAEEFCLRLGWVLAHPVRLPTETEFRAAAADEVLPASGFQGLAGGEAEWLQAGAGDTAVLAGGGAAGAAANLGLRTAPKTGRARTNGLRVVVEADLAAPAER